MTLSVSQIKSFLKERLLKVVSVDVKSIRDGCSASEVDFNSPEDIEKEYKAICDFVKELVEFCELQFYVIDPYGLPGLCNKRKPGRPKGSKSTKSKKKDKAEKTIQKIIRGDDYDLPATEDEVRVAKIEKDGPPAPADQTEKSFTSDIMICDRCGYIGLFSMLNGYPICPECGYNSCI